MNRFRRTSAIVLMAIAPAAAGCSGSGKHLVFFTNTSVGLDIGTDPSSTGANIQIGYERQEGVLNPVRRDETKVTKEGNGTVVKEVKEGELREHAYSVIAKYAGSARAQERAEVSNAQWFATGRAAELLAQAPGIAGAVTGSPGVAEAAAKESSAVFRNRELPPALELQYLAVMLETIEADASRGSAVSAGVMQRVNDFAKKYATRDLLYPAGADEEAEALIERKYVSVLAEGEPPWRALGRTTAQLAENVGRLTKALEAHEADPQNVRITVNGRALEAEGVEELRRVRENQIRLQESFEDEWRSAPPIAEAVHRFIAITEGR